MYRIIGADGREYGPVSAEQLKQWISEGRVNAQTYTLAEGTNEWKALGSFPEFFFAPQHQLLPSAAFPPNASARQTNNMAILGLIFGMIAITFGLCCCYGLPFNLLGLIFSLIGYSETRKAPEIYNGQGIAIAGIVISVLSLLLMIGLGMVFGAASILDAHRTPVYNL
ncbi:MAG TPA: GYF domain-containing protein [Candidatus Paceibacterota bacterium]|nr:GYF domain-containing protein [Candidatus Paceibacterota bacterium]